MDSYKIQLSDSLILASAEANPEFYLIDPKTKEIIRKYQDDNFLSRNTLNASANFGHIIA